MTYLCFCERLGGLDFQEYTCLRLLSLFPAGVYTVRVGRVCVCVCVCVYARARVFVCLCGVGRGYMCLCVTVVCGICVCV